MLRPSAGETLRAWLLSALVVHGAVAGNPDAKRLYDDLLSNYNKLVRPVVNTSDVLRVCIKLKLSQLIDVLSSKMGYSLEHSPKKAKKNVKGDRDFVTLWDPRLKADFDSRRMLSDETFPFAAYDNSYEGIHMSEEIFSKNLEEKLSDLKDRRLKPNFAEENSVKRQTSNSQFCFKPKRKSHKAYRSDTLKKKFKNVESMREFKKLLENFRIIDEKELNASKIKFKNSKNVVPAYFVLKLAEKSGKNLMPSEDFSSSTTQSFKLVFAKDDGENCVKEKAINCPSWLSIRCHSDVKTQDKVTQTEQDNYVFIRKNNLQNSQITSEDKLGEENDLKYCMNCLKMKDDFTFQRELNASLLEQIKNMQKQLTGMVALLNDFLICKTVTGKNNRSTSKKDDLSKEHFFQAIVNTKGANKEKSLGASDVLTQKLLMHTNVEPLHNAENCCESVNIFKDKNENIKKEIGAVLCPRKYKDGVHFLSDEINGITEKRLREKIESAVSDVKYKCCCHNKPGYENAKEDSPNSSAKNHSSNFRIGAKEYLQGSGVEAFQRRDEYEKQEDEMEEAEEADYDGSGSDTEDHYDNTETVTKKVTKQSGKEENKHPLQKMRDQVRVSSQETNYESKGNDGISNEDNTPKLSSGASSFLTLVKSNRIKSGKSKQTTINKTTLGSALSKIFLKKKKL